MPWQGLQSVAPRKFTCGYCGSLVASAQGFYNNAPERLIYVCPHCGESTQFGKTGQVPGVSPGNDVSHLPDDIAALYAEARRCIAGNSCTASVLICRKLLMNIAVAQGANAGDSFVSYVEYLANKGFVPPNGRGWVDHIRNKGNEANHEIKLMSQADAEELVSFAEMLLKFIYEFPNRVPPKSP
jgi:hypothetical protein